MSPPTSPSITTVDPTADPNAAAAGNNGTGITKRYRTQPSKTFQCTGYGDCRMVFSRSEHLARHVRKHTGERPFTCHCSKQFSRLDNLRQHAQTVHADKLEQNEALMKDLTSIHTAMAAGKGRKRNANAANRNSPTSPSNSVSASAGRPEVKHELEHGSQGRNLDYPSMSSYTGHVSIPSSVQPRPGYEGTYPQLYPGNQHPSLPQQPRGPFRTASDESMASTHSFQQQLGNSHSFPSPVSPPPHRYGPQPSFQLQHPHPYPHNHESFRTDSPGSASAVSPLSVLPTLPTPPPGSHSHSFLGGGMGSRGDSPGNESGPGSGGPQGSFPPVASSHGVSSSGISPHSFRPHPFEHAAYGHQQHHSGGGNHSFRGHSGANVGGHSHGEPHSFLGSGSSGPGIISPLVV